MNAAVGADERLVVLLEARISEFEKRMAKAEGRGTRTYQNLRRGSKGATAQMEEDMNRASGRINQALAAVSGRIGTFGKAFLGGFIGAAALETLRGAVSRVADLAQGVAQVGDEARRAGMSAKEFQEWSYVAQQNRIGIDQMVDGLKELQLRGDEFATTGKGSAAEAFARLGYTAEEVARKLEDPSALMLELLGRMEQLDKAAQIRIGDELFGGTGGERFVELLEQGADRIRDTKAEASDLGLVMSDELIARADQLHREFSAIASTVGVVLKSAIISAAASLSDFIDGFREFENQRSTTLQARQGEIMRERAKLNEELTGLASDDDIAPHARDLGFGPDSEMTRARIDALRRQMDALTEEEDRIIGVLSSRTPVTWRPDNDGWTPPETPAEAPSGRSRGGRSGGSRTDGFEDAMAKTRDQIAANLAEAESLDDLARSSMAYGGSVEFARKRAELLLAAQKAGIALTPELEAGIDRLAQSYVESGQAAEEAAERMKRIEEAGARGREALGKVFDAIIEGGGNARKAIADLLMEMAKIQFRKGMFSLLDGAGGGGLLADLGSMLLPSADGGGYTGNAPRSGGLDGKGGFLALLHPRETVTDHTKGQTAPSRTTEALSVTIGFDGSAGGFTAFVRDQAGRVVAQAAPQIVSQSVSATYQRAREVPIG